ncbi:MAG: hypothetical protein HUU02_16715 [Bacteroidetes bacterium]|nr:hypothetical protein [Bacteroidota bacterium]
MKYFALFCLLLMVGCTGSEEDASANLRKGDEFLAKGQYEIAEYYYDKIPEESVLYKTVERRRKEIEASVPRPAASGSSSEVKRNGVFILKESHVLQLGKMPIHTITVENATNKRLNVIELEFIYRNGSGAEVQRMTTMVNAGMDPQTEKVLDQIAPGMINQPFSTVAVVVKRTMLF